MVRYVRHGFGRMGWSEFWREQDARFGCGEVARPSRPAHPPAVALIFWAAGALVFAALPQGSDARPVIATIFSLSAAAFAAVVFLRAAPRAQGHERAFLRLMGAGMVFRLAGNSMWSAAETTNDPLPGLGLRYMRQRAREVGADLDVISTPGRGNPPTRDD